MLNKEEVPNSSLSEAQNETEIKCLSGMVYKPLSLWYVNVTELISLLNNSLACDLLTSLREFRLDVPTSSSEAALGIWIPFPSMLSLHFLL